MGTIPDDLTARARLRDAAIECFAAHGFNESLRTIAARAGVSAGLVRHHFGSKEQLRAECDASVLRQYQTLKAQNINAEPAQLFVQLPSSRESGILLAYILRSVRDGGAAGREFLDHLVTETVKLTRDAVERGLLVPSRDEQARVRLLIYQSIGALVVRLAIRPDTALDDFQGIMETFYADSLLPTLELFTEGLLRERSHLEHHLHYLATTQPSPAVVPKEAPSR